MQVVAALLLMIKKLKISLKNIFARWLHFFAGGGCWEGGLRQAGHLLPPHLQPPTCSRLLLNLEAGLHRGGAPGDCALVLVLVVLVGCVSCSSGCGVGYQVVPCTRWLRTGFGVS